MKGRGRDDGLDRNRLRGRPPSPLKIQIDEWLGKSAREQDVARLKRVKAMLAEIADRAPDLKVKVWLGQANLFIDSAVLRVETAMKKESGDGRDEE